MSFWRVFNAGTTAYGDVPQSRLLRVLVGVVLPLFFVCALICARAMDPDVFRNFLTEEDGPIENSQLVALLAGCVVGALISWRLYRQNQKQWALLYALGALGLLFVAGEEIDWGQDFFNWTTPRWLLEQNARARSETNIHNLVGFNLVFGLLPTLIPLFLAALSAVSTKISRQTLDQWCAYLWIPHPILIPSWFCVVANRVGKLVYIALHPGIYPVPYPYFDKEIGETILYVAVLLFLLTVFARITRKSKVARIA